MFENFRADIDRYIALDDRPWFMLLLAKQGLWALAEYRFSYWVRQQIHFPILRQGLKLISFIWHKNIEILTGIDISSEAKLGKGIYIAHFGGIFINPEVQMGDYCNVSHQVTIGLGGRGQNQGCPKIGDRVFIGPGSKLFGRIEIGHDAAIGANAVVTKNIPAQAVAVGIPAQVINYNTSEDYIIYPS